MIPFRKENEWSGNGLARNYIGGGQHLTAKLKNERARKIAELRLAGQSATDAERWVDQYWVGWRRILNSPAPATLYATGDAVAYLREEKILFLRTEIPQPKTGEVSIARITSLYVGGPHGIEKIFLQERQRKILELQSKQYTPEEAELWVEDHWIGIRKSKTVSCWHIASEAVAYLCQEKKLVRKTDMPPPSRKGEQSCIMMSRKYVGGSKLLCDNLKAERERKIAELQEKGQSKEAAQQWVEENWIGTRTPLHGKPSLYAAADAIAHLQEKGVLRKREDEPPPAQKRDQSLFLLRKIYSVSPLALKKQINKERQRKIAELQAKGQTQKEAEQWVADYWIGMRKRKTSMASLHVTQEAVDYLCQKGVLRKRSLPMPPILEGEQSSSKLSKEFVGGNIAIRRKLKIERQRKIAELQGCGMTLQGAENWVDSNWIGLRQPKTGPVALCASPGAVSYLQRVEVLIQKTIPEVSDPELLAMLESKIPQVEIASLTHSSTARTQERIRALINRKSPVIRKYAKERAQNSSISKDEFLKILRESKGIVEAAEKMALAPRRVMARLGRYCKLEPELLRQLDNPLLDPDLAGGAYSQFVPKDSLLAAWVAVKELRLNHSVPPDLNQLARYLGIPRALAEHHVNFLISSGSIVRADLAQALPVQTGTPSALRLRLDYSYSR